MQAFLARGGDASELARVEESARSSSGERSCHHGRGPLEAADKVAVLVDDGLATGATMRAAVRALSARRHAHVVVAVPVGSATASTWCARSVEEGPFHPTAWLAPDPGSHRAVTIKRRHTRA